MDIYCKIILLILETVIYIVIQYQDTVLFSQRRARTSDDNIVIKEEN